MEWLVFSRLSISAFTQFLLALLITVYLVTVRKKAGSTWMLVLFFGGFTGSLADAHGGDGNICGTERCKEWG